MSALSSEWLWNIDWGRFFPFRYESKCGEVSVSLTDFTVASEFMAAEMASAYHEDLNRSPFALSEMTPAKVRFYSESADLFKIVRGDEIIGIITCNPVDWATYYLRSVVIKKEYQGQGVFQPFLNYLLEILRAHGVERAEAEISPSNLGQIHTHNKLGFNVTGTTLSERWGCMTRFTKFLSARHEEVFLKQFCFGRRPQLALRKTENPRQRENEEGI